MDDFAAKTDRRFDEVDRRLDEVDRRFDGIDKRFEAVERRMENGFGELNARFDAMQRALFQIGGGMIAALVGLIATQL